MPKFLDEDSFNEKLYDDIKDLRLNATSKRLRHLRTFERIYYKKICEVTKTGHNLEDIHCLDDGNMRHTAHNLIYSLNKKKRWLLPDIIQRRICDNELSTVSPKGSKGDQMSTVDERLKIVMYENENIRHSSTCFLYGNSQTEPHIIYRNGRRFNSKALTRWIDFDTRERWGRRNRRRRRIDNGDNQPNFGIKQRPGFFPSEVTYQFMYPKRFSSGEDCKQSKTSLSYHRSVKCFDRFGRDTAVRNTSKRRARKYECMKYDFSEQEYEIDGENIDRSSYSTANDEYSSGHCDKSLFSTYSVSVDLPLEYFIKSTLFGIKSSSCSNNGTMKAVINDRKALKYLYELSKSNEELPKQAATEVLLCSIRSQDESSLLSLMQRPELKLSQANISPAIFLQQTTSSTFSVLYEYVRATSIINATLKFTGLPPSIIFNETDLTVEKLVAVVSHTLEHASEQSQNEPTKYVHVKVDELRGSLPLPLSTAQKMILVRPNAIDKLSALKQENLLQDNIKRQQQWYSIRNSEHEMFECAVCCDALTYNDVYQLHPCQHSICHSCLTSYIRTSVSTATYSSSSMSSIICFQQNCSTQLNSCLLQAFVSYEIYQSYYQALLDRRLFSLGNYRKCPSRACSKVLVIDDAKRPALMCSCGQRVCSECLEEYHFPATCQQYRTYVGRLRESGDDILSSSKTGENSSCYIAEGKNCPNCGEFVEKNGGCPHMTCRCGSEYCWMCLKRWATHRQENCSIEPVSIYELRSSTRNRLHNKAVNHRRERNQYSFNQLFEHRERKIDASVYDTVISTYIDLNTLAEFIYVLLQQRRINVNIRAVLSRTARRLESDAFQIKLQLEWKQLKTEHIERIRFTLQRTVSNLLHMRKNKLFS